MARPLLPWHFPTQYWPAAGKECWVRRLPWYDKPVLAVSNGEGLFSVAVQILIDPPAPYDPQLSWNEIHSWKFRYLADELAAFPPSE